MGANAIDERDPAVGGLDGATCWRLLVEHFMHRPEVRDCAPTYAQLQVFVGVLAQQLRSFRDSGFFAVWLLKEGGHTAVRHQP